MIVVRYNGRFVTNEDGSWEYINGRNKARVIRSNCTYEELQEIVYEVTKIDRNSFQIIMKYLFHSCYKLDPIEIEDNRDVQCFLKEQFCVDTQYRSPLYRPSFRRISSIALNKLPIFVTLAAKLCLSSGMMNFRYVRACACRNKPKK